MWQNAKNVYHLLVAVLANFWFRFPGKKLIVIGVTGTDGKTTTVNLVYHILIQAKKRVSMISTVGAMINGEAFPLGFHVTNPSSIPLQSFLYRAAKEKGKTYLVLEVTSHGLDQNRVWGIPFSVAGITNVSHEHLDYHKTYENYVKTKGKLLKKAKIAIVNKDDDSYQLLSKIIKKEKGKKILTYSRLDEADLNIKLFPFKTKLIGTYNEYNILLASLICRELGLTSKEIHQGIASFIPPTGRTEIVYDKEFTVMIDFAHTPNSFTQLLPEIKARTKGRLIHVFGSAGKRDSTKRPKMGKVASIYDDIIILTSEDPRSESIESINKQISSGFTRSVTKYEIEDRAKAILEAIKLAKKGDFVLLTGKAHETSMNLGKGEEPWSEYGAVKSALRVINKKN